MQAFFDERVTLPLRRERKELSSFLSSQTERANGVTVYEQEKMGGKEREK